MTVETLTFEDLENDDAFIDGLKNEEFILVLGAGFSYGIKNQSELCESIPLVKDFLEVTNDCFQEEQNEYRFAVKVWKEQNCSEEFNKLFLVDKKAFDKTHYSKIFIPHWYNIYTLNFDNVLDCCMPKDSQYQSFKYPEATGNQPKSISYLHGKINPAEVTASQFDEIVFSYETYDDIGISLHTLYDSLHSNVGTLHKKIIIIGTQFTEETVSRLFFKELPSGATIYHFEISGNNTKRRATDAGIDYKFIQLTQDKGVCEIFEFFEAQKHRIRRLDIEGALIIDNSFKKSVLEKNNEADPQPKSFYLSKQSNNYQWYGCLQGWAFEQSFYKVLKETVINSFKTDRDSKVSAVVHGRGGTGKSIQLRLLALDLIEQDFTVIWLEDFDVFEESIKEIEDSNQQCLIIIEDWYRLSDQCATTKTAPRVLKKLCKLDNIRIVIGDRAINPAYKSHISPENRFEITSNDEVLPKITDVIKAWQPIYKNLKKQDIGSSPIFLLLFIMAKTAEEHNTDIVDLDRHFKELVASDVKKLKDECSGLAMALVYIAKIYKEQKLFITKDFIICLSHYFESDSNPELILNNTGHFIRDYLHIDKAAFAWDTTEYIYFNHDILVEVGLYESIDLELNDTKNYQILGHLIQDTKDDRTLSSYVSHLLQDKDKNALLNLDKQKTKTLIEDLSNKNQHHFSFFFGVTSHSAFSNANKRALAQQILNKFKTKKISGNVIKHCLYFLKDDQEAEKILKRFAYDKEDISHVIIFHCLDMLKGKDESISSAKEILKRYTNGEDINHQIIGSCLDILKGKDEAIEILKRYINGEDINPDIIDGCFNLLQGKDVAISAAEEILKRFAYDKEDISRVIICRCLDMLKGKNEAISAAEEILKRLKEGEDIAPEIICRCLGVIEEREVAEKFLERFAYNKENINHDLICSCFKVLQGKNESIDPAKEILKRFKKGEDIAPKIICSCFKVLQGKDVAISAAREILKRYINGEDIAFEIICRSLDVLQGEEKGKDYAIDILELKNNQVNQPIKSKCFYTLREDQRLLPYSKYIIDDIENLAIPDPLSSKKGNPNHVLAGIRVHSLFNYALCDKDHGIVSEAIENKYKAPYFNILKFPFFCNDSWYKEFQSIKCNWRHTGRNLIAIIIYSGYHRPGETEALCRIILKEWKNEISYLIERELNLDHIKLAFSHPNLTPEFLREKAAEILAYQENKQRIEDKDLLTQLKGIIDTKE